MVLQRKGVQYRERVVEDLSMLGEVIRKEKIEEYRKENLMREQLAKKEIGGIQTLLVKLSDKYIIIIWMLSRLQTGDLHI